MRECRREFVGTASFALASVFIKNRWNLVILALQDLLDLQKSKLYWAHSACKSSDDVDNDYDVDDDNNKWSENFAESVHCMLCRYWWFSDSFYHSRDSQCLSLGRTTPQSCFVGGFWSHLIHGSLGSPESAPQTASRSVELFCVTHPCDQHRRTDRQTVYSNRPRLCNLYGVA